MHTIPQLMLLKEAGMSRRGFLKFLGKAAGAAAGAPLEKLGNMAAQVGSAGLERLVGQAYDIVINVPMVGMHGPDSLSSVLSKSVSAFSQLKKLVGPKEVKTYNADYFSFHTLLSGKGDLNSVLEKLKNAGIPVKHTSKGTLFGDGYKTEKDRWFIPSLDMQIAGLDQDSRQLKYVSELPETIDPVLDWWKEYGDHIYKDYLSLDDKGLKILKKHGLDPIKEKEGWERRSAEREEQERRYKKQWEAEQPTKPNYAGRETGHERENQFSPIPSRPTQALGPFESRLRDSLKVVF